MVLPTFLITIDATLMPSGVDEDDLAAGLARNVESAIARGLLEADPRVAVESHDVRVDLYAGIPSADDVTAYWKARIEDGSLSLEDVPALIADFGALSTLDFAKEMRARMGVKG